MSYWRDRHYVIHRYERATPVTWCCLFCRSAWMWVIGFQGGDPKVMIIMPLVESRGLERVASPVVVSSGLQLKANL